MTVMIIYYIIYNKCLTCVSDLSCPRTTVCCSSVRRHIVITLNTRIEITKTTDYWFIKKSPVVSHCRTPNWEVVTERTGVHTLAKGRHGLLTREWQAALSKGFCASGN